MKKLLIIGILVLGPWAGRGLFAQQRVTPDKGIRNLDLQLDYQLSQPLGSLRNYTSPLSGRSWNVQLWYPWNSRVSTGLQLGYGFYYQQFPRLLYSSKTTTVSAVQTHTLQNTPLLLEGRYQWPSAGNRLIPYADLGLGASAVHEATYWGEFVEPQNRIAFTAEPAAGVLYQPKPGSALSLNAAIGYTFTAYHYQQIHQLQSLQLSLGIRLELRHQGGDNQNTRKYPIPPSIW